MSDLTVIKALAKELVITMIKSKLQALVVKDLTNRIVQKGAALPEGTVRERKDGKYKKTNGQGVRVADGDNQEKKAPDDKNKKAPDPEKNYMGWVTQLYNGELEDFKTKEKEKAELVAANTDKWYVTIRERMLGKAQKLKLGTTQELQQRRTLEFVDKCISETREYIRRFPLKSDVTVYRGVAGNDFDMQVGDHYQANNFTSWSTVEKIAKGFAAGQSSSTEIIMKCTFKKGDYIAPALRKIDNDPEDKTKISIEDNHEERELIAEDGYMFKIIGRKEVVGYTGGRATLLEVERVPK